MDMVTKEYCGITYWTPKTFRFTHKTVGGYRSYCGAGEGIGDKVIPDKIGGNKVSHICHIHDHSWAIAEASFVEFMISNLMFLFNLLTYLMRFGGPVARVKNMCIGFGYFIGVSSPVGWKIFKNLKEL